VVARAEAAAVSAPSLDAVYRRSERIVTRRIAGECVLVPLARRGADMEAMYSLNPTAAFVWDQMEGDVAGTAIVDAVVEHFDVERATAERDYLGLVAALLDLDALAPASRPSEG
jgi:hypothetical protein